MKATCIAWDTDGDRELERNLPKEIELPDWIEKDDYDAINDFLSNVTGFCHYGYVLEAEDDKYMNTAEMWLKAQNDGKIYECVGEDIAYSKDMGLVDKDDFNRPWCLDAWEYKKQYGLDDLMSCKWQEMDNTMTIEEAELKFGIKIIV